MQLTVNLVENIFYIWPQYIALVNRFIEWADQIEIFTEAEVYYTETYDLLVDSLEDQIYIIEHSIHKMLDALTTIPHIPRETIDCLCPYWITIQKFQV